MALVVICGQPSSGKSTIAEKLKHWFTVDGGVRVTLVDEPSLHMAVRDESYKNAVQEKHTRGKLKSAVERALSEKGTVVILDSLNNIKGYRYELWCIARSAGCKYCMVHVDSPSERCREWNQSRVDTDKYSVATMEDLLGRFERPDARNRWDAPLFTVHPEPSSSRSTTPGIPMDSIDPREAKETGGFSPFDKATDSLPQLGLQPSTNDAEALGGFSTSSVTACNAAGNDDSELQGEYENLGHDFPMGPMDDDLLLDGRDLGHGLPREDEAIRAIVEAMVGPRRATGSSRTANELSLGSSGRPALGKAESLHCRSQHHQHQALMPTFATSSTPLLGTNTLNEIDQAAQGIITAICDAQEQAVGGAPGIVQFGAGVQPLKFEQPVTLAELRRHKRAFLKLATKILLARLQDGHTASRLFADYIRQNVAGAGCV